MWALGQAASAIWAGGTAIAAGATIAEAGSAAFGATILGKGAAFGSAVAAGDLGAAVTNGLDVVGQLPGGGQVGTVAGMASTGINMVNAIGAPMTAAAGAGGTAGATGTKGAGSGGTLGAAGPGAATKATGLPDDALVCRGGTCTAERFRAGTGITIDSAGKMDGVSVNSAPGKTVKDLTATFPQNQVGVTTVGDVRRLGGDVVSSPTFDKTGKLINPDHSTLKGLTPQQAEKLFTPTRPNPWKVK